MTDSSTAAETDSTFDPGTVAERAGVDSTDRTYVHETTDHCEVDAAGRVVVGVTDDRGRCLLLVDHERSIAVLPNAVVAPGDDWLTAAREVVAEATGLDVVIDDPVRVRRVEHTTEETDEPHNVSSHVLFEATCPDDDSDLTTTEDSSFEVGWYDGLPVEIPDDLPRGGDVLEDIGAFVDIDD
jgi:hypothetical protein